MHHCRLHDRCIAAFLVLPSLSLLAVRTVHYPIGAHAGTRPRRLVAEAVAMETAKALGFIGFTYVLTFAGVTITAPGVARPVLLAATSTMLLCMAAVAIRALLTARTAASACRMQPAPPPTD